MFKFTLLALLIVFASASFGIVQPEGSMTYGGFNCYRMHNIRKVVSTIWDQTLGPRPLFTDNYSDAKKAGLVSDAIIKMSDVSSPQDICEQTVHTLPSAFTDTVWISLYPADDWKKPVEQRMAYLDSVIQTCQSHGLNLGIYSSFDQWTNVFGDRSASSATVQALPVFYINDGTGYNFYDFNETSFGGWTAPTMKEYNGQHYYTPCFEQIDGNVFYESV